MSFKDASAADLIRAGFWGAIGGAAFYVLIAAVAALVAPKPNLVVTTKSATGDCGCGCGK